VLTRSPGKPFDFEIKVSSHLKMLAREMFAGQSRVHTKCPVKPFEFEIKLFLRLNMLVREMFAGQRAYKVSSKTI
jgi:hypothetical protein